MDKVKLKAINDLSEKIEITERSIRTIDSLLLSCSLSILISGTPASRRNVLEYRCGNKEYVKVLLISEKKRLEIDLQELKNEFLDL